MIQKPSKSFEYTGEELDIFALAKNWKQYWKSKLQRFIGPTVLEVGAGIGSTTLTLYSSPLQYQQWTAIEPDTVMVNNLIRRQELGEFPASVTIKHGTLDILPKNKKFHSILYIDVLEHIENDSDELKKTTQYLYEGGTLIVLSPAYDFLFTEFDKAIGHYRRYNAKKLLSLMPDSLKVEKLFYLDSIGVMTSLVNKFILHSPKPTIGQIKLWDKVIVPVSRWISDPLLGYSIGRSVVAVWRKQN